MIGLDMPMPASCTECKYKGAKWCYIEIWSNHGAKEVTETGRPDWCPMVDLSAWEDDGKWLLCHKTEDGSQIGTRSHA